MHTSFEYNYNILQAHIFKLIVSPFSDLYLHRVQEDHDLPFDHCFHDLHVNLMDHELQNLQYDLANNHIQSTSIVVIIFFFNFNFSGYSVYNARCFRYAPRQGINKFKILIHIVIKLLLSNYTNEL